LIGTGRCWDPGLLFRGGPWLGRQVAFDLALQQAAEFYDPFDRGRVTDVRNEVERRVAHLERGIVRLATLSQHDHRELSY
jgi:hypothetical protein